MMFVEAAIHQRRGKAFKSRIVHGDVAEGDRRLRNAKQFTGIICALIYTDDNFGAGGMLAPWNHFQPVTGSFIAISAQKNTPIRGQIFTDINPVTRPRTLHFEQADKPKKEADGAPAHGK